jgi:hypothetical protein
VQFRPFEIEWPPVYRKRGAFYSFDCTLFVRLSRTVRPTYPRRAIGEGVAEQVQTGAPTAPRPPFAEWPVQHFDPLIGFFWYAHPAAFVSQTVVAHGSRAVVERQNDLLDRVLALRADEIRAHGGILIFNDWRSVTGYDQDARARQRARMEARPAGYARRTIIIVKTESRLLRMAIEATNLLGTLKRSAQIEVDFDPAHAFSQVRLGPPLPGIPFPR